MMVVTGLAVPVVVTLAARRHEVARLKAGARQATPAMPPTASVAGAWFTEPAW
jgi:hypothetical protein